MAKSNLVAMKTKAAIALAFVGGMNHCCMPAIGEDKIRQAVRTFKITDSASTPPSQSLEQTSRQAEFRAYRLLLRAEGYLSNDDRAQVEASYPVEPVSVNFRFRLHDGLPGWAERLAAGKASKAHAAKNAGVAIDTVNKAIVELKSVSDQYAKLNMYFIASLLLQKAGDKKGFQKCDGVIEQFIRSCETSQLVDEQEIAAAVSVLNSKSYGIIAVEIPYQHQSSWTNGGHLGLPESPFTERDLAKSEALWLRSAALADKLNATANTRRMVHRDLSLWYKLVGKNDEAERQKQILFNLIGQENDKFLYPTQGICGALLWWTAPPKNLAAMACGMG